MLYPGIVVVLDLYKREHADEPSRLKYILATERLLRQEPDMARQQEILAELGEGLINWVDNPLRDEEAIVQSGKYGLYPLMKDIEEFEAPAFFEGNDPITEGEAMTMANMLIERARKEFLNEDTFIDLLLKIRAGYAEGVL